MGTDAVSDHTWSGTPVARPTSGGAPADSLDGVGRGTTVIHWVPRPPRLVRALFVTIVVLLAMLLFLLAMLFQTMSGLGEHVRAQSATAHERILARAGMAAPGATATGALLNEGPDRWWPALAAEVQERLTAGRTVAAAAHLQLALAGERAGTLDPSRSLALAELWAACGRLDRAAAVLAVLDWSALDAAGRARALALQARLRR